VDFVGGTHMNFDTQRGNRAALGTIIFEEFSYQGRMSFERFDKMCDDRGFTGKAELEDEEKAAAFLRLAGDRDYIDYDTFYEWWKTQEERVQALKFTSDGERQQTLQAKKSFYVATGGSDFMNKEEFRLKCYLSGYCLSDHELDEAFLQMDSDNSGQIEFVEYLRWRNSDDRFKHLLQSDEHAEYVHQVGDFFRYYDSKLRGRLSTSQFQPLYKSLVDAGEVSATYDEVVSEVDTDGDGMVSLNEFMKWYATSWETEKDEGSP